MMLREAFAWLAGPAARPILALTAILVGGQIFFAGYDAWVLGLPIVREGPADFAVIHLVQSLFLLFVCAALVLALVRSRATTSRLDTASVAPAGLAAGAAAMVAAGAAALLLAADPTLFHDFAQEDRPLEWASALLLFAGSGMFGLLAFRRRADAIPACIAAGLCIALAVVGLEEISWGQRLLGFATPEALAQANWQHEFNVHNVQTDLFETLYYAGSAGFLIVLPFIGDLVAAADMGLLSNAYIPRRETALASAPLLWFDHGHWNLYAIQLGAFLGAFAIAAWSWGAHRRGDRVEAGIFALSAFALVAGKLAFLALGGQAVDLPDPTEYKEFFIAWGFFVYALDVRRRAGAD